MPSDSDSHNEWDRVASSAQFRDLMAIKKVFIVPAFLFFLLYYFLLPVLVGYAPKLMSTRVIGTMTLAYVFALSQFVVGWLIAWLYLKAAARFDSLAEDILEDLNRQEPPA
ncbi:MAG TPA: DUF485 domain-containing protein [Verrucomicrobiae bacterium]|nr:DUF485 domain-containing protein [Verrucomicrobiae bacterium]